MARKQQCPGGRVVDLSQKSSRRTGTVTKYDSAYEKNPHAWVKFDDGEYEIRDQRELAWDETTARTNW